jgi:4-amino-4-deoxy-L-arabinose transferase-like glycosyltransferase
MPALWNRTWVQVLLVGAVAAAMVFPHLGTPGLWDDDEGVNAECAREMAEADNWIVPTFNWEIRTAKPILLYWMLRFSYAACGVNEFAARLPSAIAFIFTVVLVYDLARRMFDKTTGLLAAAIAMSSLELVKQGRGCTTDMLLILFTTLYFWSLFRGTRDGGRGWFVPCAVASALATLTKGPAVGLLLIVGVVGTWFLWNGELKRIFDRRFLWASLAWGLVAIPWYAVVGAESGGEWLKGFFLKENLGRSTEAMEGHRGTPFYYPIWLCVMFAPWSFYLAITCWQTFKRCLSSPSPPRGEGDSNRDAYRLLAAWIGVYLLAFTVVATKLPHYIAPAYPPLAILTAAAIVRWMRGLVEWPWWGFVGGAGGLALVGLLIGAGLFVAGMGERLGIPKTTMRFFPGLEAWAWLGLIPMAGSIAMILFQRKGNRPAAVASFAVSTVVFTALVAAFPPLVIDQSKATKVLVAETGARQLDCEIVVASFDYSQPSLTFYARRRVQRLWNAKEVNDALNGPLPLFLFVKEETWNGPELGGKVTAKFRIAAKRYDFYRGKDILVITNR